MSTNKLTYILTSGILASTLIFSMGTGSAFANGEETEPFASTLTTTEPTEMVGGETSTETELVETSADDNGTAAEFVEPAADETNSSSEEQVSGGSEEATPNTTEESEQQEVDEPSLVPGDFFYFVKIMTEKIRLAITADDYKEAKLLAEFSAERIAEANVLFADGKADEAAELLKEAIATQEQASEELTNLDETSDTEDSRNEEESSDQVEVTAESKLAHNIDALLMALGNVKNPTAQQALMKNIQKSFVKLDKRLGKLEEKDPNLADKMQEMKGKFVTEELPENQASLGKEMSDKKNDKTDSEEIATEADQEIVKTEAEQTDAEKAEVKQLEASSKAQAKTLAAAVKGEAKQQEAAERVEVKQQSAATKEKQAIVPSKPEQKSQEGPTNAVAKENGKGNDKGNH
ncbi:DUF5667 domain-containing protein [Neobacillus jeddahensis]|uniref:DUF5667 domain-containing protein n=1 Tax=Neobacillus jeddahensis TaxID=1461580 RepID=UPI00058CE9F3|nr:DUF5667 domain-containing protein [Neobacillus jeddahensis]